eukprot:1709886-Pyramimonas_sp.AAC.1
MKNCSSSAAIVPNNGVESFNSSVNGYAVRGEPLQKCADGRRQDGHRFALLFAHPASCGGLDRSQNPLLAAV